MHTPSTLAVRGVTVGLTRLVETSLIDGNGAPAHQVLFTAASGTAGQHGHGRVPAARSAADGANSASGVLGLARTDHAVVATLGSGRYSFEAAYAVL